MWILTSPIFTKCSYKVLYILRMFQFRDKIMMKAIALWCSAMKRHKSYYHTLCQRYGNPKGMLYYKKSFYMMSTPKENKLLWQCISSLGILKRKIRERTFMKFTLSAAFTMYIIFKGFTFKIRFPICVCLREYLSIYMT